MTARARTRPGDDNSTVSPSAVIAALGACVAAVEARVGASLSLDEIAERDVWLARCGVTRSARAFATDVVLLALCRHLVGDRPENAFLHAAAAPVSLEPWLIQATTHMCRTDGRMLGSVYEALVDRTQRYGVGQYFTPPLLADFMQEQVRARGAVTVLDPAIGAGALVASLGPRVALRGFDTSPLCVALATAGLMLRGVHDVKVVCKDFLERRECSTGASDGLVDAVICNPPYVRHHLLARDVKKEAVTRLGDTWNVKLSSLSTSYVYFMLEALTRVRDGGTLVFITPADFLETRFGVGLKAALQSHAVIEDIFLFDRMALAFDGVLTTSAITVARKGQAHRPHAVRFHETVVVDHTVRSIHTTSHRQETLDPAAQWSSLWNDKRARHAVLVRDRPCVLGDYLKIRRGIATGANAFFVLSQPTVDLWGIEPEHLVPVVASARDLPDDELTLAHWNGLRSRGRPCWLLAVQAPWEDLSSSRVRAYLEHGTAQGVHLRFNCRTRRPWYRPENVPAPDVIVTYMNRKRMRFVRNSAGCRVLSVFLNGFVRHEAVDISALLGALHAPDTAALIDVLGRTYGSGLRKMEPRELSQLPMPRLPHPVP